MCLFFLPILCQALLVNFTVSFIIQLNCFSDQTFRVTETKLYFANLHLFSHFTSFYY